MTQKHNMETLQDRLEEMAYQRAMQDAKSAVNALPHFTSIKCWPLTPLAPVERVEINEYHVREALVASSVEIKFYGNWLIEVIKRSAVCPKYVYKYRTRGCYEKDKF